jgi:hypothetical protein
MKALKITAAVLSSIVAYCILIALKAIMLPYPNTPKITWSYITSDKVTETEAGDGIALLISFTCQVLFLSLGWMWLFWIFFGITHLLISLRKLVSFWDDFTNDKNLGL